MKKVLVLLVLATSAMAFAAQPDIVINAASNDRVENSIPRSLGELNITKKSLGIGTPAPMVSVGTDKAVFVDDDYYHAPQDMPFYPTAAVIWPRVVELECEKIQGNLVCEGYHWSPKLGRGEYLFVTPKLKATPAPVPPIIVYKEVPVKPKKQ